MSINVTNNLIVDQDISSQSGIKWESTQKDVAIQEGNYGQVQDVKLTDGQLKVTTDKGTLIFSGPQLEEAKATFKDMGYLDTLDRLENISSGFDYLGCLQLLFEANKERRNTAREVRHAERDRAMSEAHHAADTIRDGALTNMWMGIIGGAISISMGAYSLKGTFSSYKALRQEAADVKMAQMETKMAGAQTRMNKAQMDLETAKTNKAPKAEITELENNFHACIKQRDAVRQDLDAQIKQAEADVEKASAKVNKNPADADALKNFDIETNKLDGLKSIQTKSREVVKGSSKDVKESIKEQTEAAAKWQKESRSHFDAISADLNTKIQQNNTKSQVSREIGQGISGIGQSYGNYVDKEAQADSREIDAEAQKANLKAEDTNQEMQGAAEVLADVIKLLDSIRQSNAQVWQQIASA